MSKEQIENCYRQMYRGMIEKDRALLSEVLDDKQAMKIRRKQSWQRI